MSVDSLISRLSSDSLVLSPPKYFRIDIRVMIFIVLSENKGSIANLMP